MTMKPGLKSTGLRSINDLLSKAKDNVEASHEKGRLLAEV